jgi:hypothetical protein
MPQLQKVPIADLQFAKMEHRWQFQWNQYGIARSTLLPFGIFPKGHK